MNKLESIRCIYRRTSWSAFLVNRRGMLGSDSTSWYVWHCQWWAFLKNAVNSALIPLFSYNIDDNQLDLNEIEDFLWCALSAWAQKQTASFFFFLFRHFAVSLWQSRPRLSRVTLTYQTPQHSSSELTLGASPLPHFTFWPFPYKVMGRFFQAYSPEAKIALWVFYDLSICIQPMVIVRMFHTYRAIYHWKAFTSIISPRWKYARLILSLVKPKSACPWGPYRPAICLFNRREWG